MKSLVLMCEVCGKCRMFSGQDADAIVKAIDDSLWDHTGRDTGICPNCLKKEAEGEAEWEMQLYPSAEFYE